MNIKVDKKTLQCAKLFSRIYDKVSEKTLKLIMADLGFTLACNYKGHAFKNKRFVIKLLYVTSRKPKRSIPTMVVKRIDSDYKIVIQPLAKMLLDSQYVEISKKPEFAKNEEWNDSHTGNWGIYKGEYVMVDW